MSEQKRVILQPQEKEMLFRSCFPDGLMENILVRLPVKPLIRFKTVSKWWRDALSCPYFVQKQVDHAKTRQKVLVYSMNMKTSTMEIKILEETKNNTFISKPAFSPYQLNPYESLVVEDSCNGLVSFRFCSSDEESCYVYFWNPATRECKQVMLPYKDVKRNCVGIAFVAKTNDYKMVRVSDNPNNDEKTSVVWVYSLNSDSWKELKADNFKYMRLHSRQAVTVDGCMHWMAEVSGRYKIVAFDVEKEVLRNLALPDTDDINHVCIERRLGVIRGVLTLLMISKSNKGWVEEIWQMNKYGVGSCWEKVDCVMRFHDMSLIPKEFCNDGINCFDRKNKKDKPHVVSYDPFTQVSKNYGLSQCEDILGMVDYTETLASLHR